ncbi:hypothetical protein DICPUDRAFT_78014 [Dictyostelium purpureum]|uniref:Anaphase-promoting complex subunit 4 WD40 domain-containing protein n=1 Tax=Dictyostelium purpureum TaxID=5786 RepID=F0ZIB3_DICPU|nr:uncharacterized protein DICPUDRAFT_78014 [Dictyostelium purpureum]EGC36328.1 hypothetical protein DICPUDRAFT_78014 [Dictyostelium purpureum]|eukprot:XP_003287143.1 hypothetical protein DICPUDRAFT_78014 [Dictyostelium purpureum]
MEETCDIYTAKVKSLGKTSPASLNSNRSLVLTKNESIVASENKIIKVKVDLPKIEKKIFSKIKGIPSPFKIDTVEEKLYETKLKHEIQSISSTEDNKRVSAIDSSGSCWIADYHQSDLVNSFTIDSSKGESDGFTELGWAGLSFNTSDQSIFARTQFYQKRIEIFKGDQLAQSIQLIQNPTQIQYFNHEKSNSALLAVTEFNQLKIYDPRQSTNNSCIQKFTPSTNWLYSIGISTNFEYIAVGGANRTVSVFDTKKWSNCGNWKNCLKYEITSIQFSNKNPSICYVGGLDSEVLAGEWNGSSGVDHFTGLRVDSRWLGLSKLKNEEFIFGFTGSSSIYYINNCEKLFQSTYKTTNSRKSHTNINEIFNDQNTEDSSITGKARTLQDSPKGVKHPSKKLKKEDNI